MSTIIESPLKKGYAGTVPLITNEVGGVALIENMKLSGTFLEIPYLTSAGASQVLRIDLSSLKQAATSPVTCLYGLTEAKNAVDTSSGNAFAIAEARKSYTISSQRSQKQGHLSAAGTLVTFNLDLVADKYYFAWFGVPVAYDNNLRFFDSNGALEKNLWSLAGKLTASSVDYNMYVRNYQYQGANGASEDVYVRNFL